MRKNKGLEPAFWPQPQNIMALALALFAIAHAFFGATFAATAGAFTSCALAITVAAFIVFHTCLL